LCENFCKVFMQNYGHFVNVIMLYHIVILNVSTKKGLRTASVTKCNGTELITRGQHCAYEYFRYVLIFNKHVEIQYVCIIHDGQ
jgi:hypothetical protein